MIAHYWYVIWVVASLMLGTGYVLRFVGLHGTSRRLIRIGADLFWIGLVVWAALWFAHHAR